MALCIERPIDRTAISDPVILQDIWQAVNRCVNNLRRKEIYKVMRERAMERFAKFIQSATELEGFDGSQVDAWINDAISTCCPGVRFYTASVSPDFQSLRYNLFESNGSTRSFTVFQKQSNEWDFAGRHPPRAPPPRRVGAAGRCPADKPSASEALPTRKDGAAEMSS